VRIVIVSDIHDNLTAIEAVLADLRDMAPDLVLHGGDVAGSGSSPAEVVDLVRNLGWSGVCGNTDEMLFRPESLDENVPGIPLLKEMAAWTREALGENRIAWLRELPRVQKFESFALIHASPESLWRSPADDAAFASLERNLVSYGHIHRPYFRNSGTMAVANSGSVGLPFDGDQRASYLLIDDSVPAIRRVEYDVAKEIKALKQCGMPASAWTAAMIEKAASCPPPG